MFSSAGCAWRALTVLSWARLRARTSARRISDPWCGPPDDQQAVTAFNRSSLNNKPFIAAARSVPSPIVPARLSCGSVKGLTSSLRCATTLGSVGCSWCLIFEPSRDAGATEPPANKEYRRTPVPWLEQTGQVKLGGRRIELGDHVKCRRGGCMRSRSELLGGVRLELASRLSNVRADRGSCVF